MDARAVINTNVASMRSEPGGRSEQVSQGLFGETVTVIDHSTDYSLIRTPDAYEGWTANHNISILETGEVYPNPKSAALIAPLFEPLFKDPDIRSERITLLTLGSIIHVAQEDMTRALIRIKVPNGDYGFVGRDSLIVPEYPDYISVGPNLAVVAHGLVGVPYLWGGRSSFGIDCSGFVQKVFWLCGHTIPRDAYVQAKHNAFESVERENLKAGDLIFFAGDHDPRGRGITHVGMYFGNGRFIHATGEQGVTIMPLAAEPYSRQFKCARRLSAFSRPAVG
ncbi:MAG: SH3 domain-containing C40 family peptidase [Chthonomonadales bacterium]